MKVIKVGRALDNDVVIDDSNVSRYHLQLVKDDNSRYSIIDTDSKHGVWVNDKQISKNKSVFLAAGDKVVVGKTKLPWVKHINDPNLPKKIVTPPPPTICNVCGKEPCTCEVVSVVGFEPKDYHVEYEKLKQTVFLPLENYQKKLAKEKPARYSSFSFSDDSLHQAEESYSRSFEIMAVALQEASKHAESFAKVFDEDMKLLDRERVLSLQRKDSNIDAIEENISTLKTFLGICQSEVQALISDITTDFNQKYPPLFGDEYETAETSNEIWNKLNIEPTISKSTMNVGKSNFVFSFFNEKITVQKFEYLQLQNNQNLIVRYNTTTKQKCLNFVNTLAGRLLASSKSGLFSLSMIDSEEMDGTCDIFKELNKTIFGIYTNEDDIVKRLGEIARHIENIIQNVLHGSVKTLADFNQNKDNKQGYHLLIIEGFPSGITNRVSAQLKKILKNGVRAGVNVLLLIDEDEISRSEENQKLYHAFNVDSIENECVVFDFVKNNFSKLDFGTSQSLVFENLNNEQLHAIVQRTNKGFETATETVVKFSDYVLPKEEWWSRKSASFIEIPFGVSADMQVQKLEITQKSGQNSAIVIGIPGSGKSVFLHSIISSASINYSPDELELYLMDFSGVEFNTYALHNLPHAKVIAPEAEREFGLSVLRELKEEGNRRAILCSNAKVNDIVDLRKAKPDEIIPRQLLIIDEFQKLFEENDPISREAQSIIEIIIREYRKFGINIILASQTIKDSPLDMQMIANRVVFEYSPYDESKVFGNSHNPPTINRTGECIYNSKSGASSANTRVQTFLIEKDDKDKLLAEITSYSKNQNYKKKEQSIFRSDDLRDIRMSRKAPIHAELQELPTEVGVYFGEPIAISDYDVRAELRKLSGDNILVIGGEQDVAQQIAIFSTMSMMDAHKNNSATFYFFNFMQAADSHTSLPEEYFSEAPFHTVQFANAPKDVSDDLKSIVQFIDTRKANDEEQHQNVYLSFYAFHRAQMFKKEDGYKLSENAKNLEYILKNGPGVGVFTVLQVDKLDSLKQSFDYPLINFSHRVALQMDEKSSNEVIGDNAAFKLEQPNRLSSKYRAYYHNPDRNISTKFRPYKDKNLD